MGDRVEQLCDICRSYDLYRCFYPEDSRDDKKFRRKWQTVNDNRKTCNFCRFIFDSLSLNKAFGFRNRRRITTVDLIFLKIGTKSWQADTSTKRVQRGSESSISETTSQHVRYLHIDAYGPNIQPLLDVRMYPTVDDTLPLRQRLLHFRRHSGGNVDLSLVAQWLETCNTEHEATCKSTTWTNMASAGLRMIDVQNRCVVEINSSVNYLALSYCWGNTTNCLKLIRSNRESLAQKDSLSDQRPDLPQTIRDAILLTQKLKKRYLWVDALCICQDDGPQKMAQVQQMDKIYQHAELTIVAAGGETSWSGLSRLRTSLKNVQEVKSKISGVDLISTYPQQDFSNALAESHWASRAWTFQEHLLSSRLLIFAQTQMAWECECARFAESLYLEPNDKDISLRLRNTTDYSSKLSNSMSPFQRYNFLVERITRRHLSFEDDRLMCLQGLFNVMAAEFPGGFWWGLPVAFFEAAILFQVGPFDEAPIERNEAFPSWCWAGWKEEIDTQITSPYDRYPKGAPRERTGFWSADHTRTPSWLRKEVAWFRLNQDEDAWIPVASSDITERNSMYYEESLRKWKETGINQLLHTARTRFKNADVPLSRMLAGWAQTVSLPVDRVRAKTEDEDSLGMNHLNEGYGNGFAIRVPSQEIIGYISLTDEYRKSQPDQLLFVLLSGHRRWSEHLGPLLDILHIETVQSVTYRVQGVRDCTLDPTTWRGLNVDWQFLTVA